MAELATVARPYAEALFRVARTGDLSAWSALVTEMSGVAAHPQVQQLATNPNLTPSKVVEVVLALLQSPLPPEARNFLSMLVENGRLTLLPEIGAQFHALKNRAAGAADMQITSAFPLSAAQVQQLVVDFEKKFGRKLNPKVSVDDSLIGGVRVAVGDEVLDTSVRAKLQQMQAALIA
jgi:F-type H+-transporting ATPase subunit delta